MWHTSRGDRTLQGAEAALVRTAIDGMMDSLLEHVDEEYDSPGAMCESGISVYDACTVHQRIGLLHEVATYLLTDTDHPLALSASLEAAIAAIFVDIRDQVAIEIGLLANEPRVDREPGWRELVLAAYKTLVTAEAENAQYSAAALDGADDWEVVPTPLPAPQSTDLDTWERLVESLCDAILWDRDFEMADSFLDQDPDISRSRRRLLGISDDYFTRIAPDPAPHELSAYVRRTRAIVRRKPR